MAQGAQELERVVEEAWERGGGLDDPGVCEAVEEAIRQLDAGLLRVAEPAGDEADDWVVHRWVHHAILLYFRLRSVEPMEAGPLAWADKIPLKRDLGEGGVRVVPPAVVRYGAHVEPGAVLMPCFVNIGARVGAYTMVDTWATVGSCAQIGRDVHLSGGVGIGGVLEPPGARPVIVEDGAFIGSRCVVVEGVRVRREAVLAAGVVLTASTPIYDVTGSQLREFRGEVPPRAVVVAGTRPRRFPAGTFQLPCALIIGWRSEATDRKTALNSLLREHGAGL